jgi:hypothetical protein
MAGSDRHAISPEILIEIAVALHAGVADITRAASQHRREER